MNTLTRKILGLLDFKRTMTLLLAVFTLVQPVSVLSLTDAQRKALSSGVRYFNTEVDSCLGAAGSLAPLTGTDNIAKIYNYLLGKTVAGQALKDFQVAGILGNMKPESGFEPQRLQSVYDKLVPADEVYPTTPQSKPTVEKTGWGLVQWTPYTKLIEPLKAAGKNPNELATQLDFLLEQLNGATPSPEKAAGLNLVATTNVAEATVSFETKYERHAGPPQPSRIVEAQRILDLARAGGVGSATVSATATTGSKPVIALDPGHGGTTISRIDPETGLRDGDYNNPAELASVFAVAQIARTQLEAAGYQVVLTKDTVDQSVFLRERANVGNNAKAALGVSIHTQGDRAFGTWQEIYVQKVGLYRGTGVNKQVFTDAVLAQASQKYADLMKKERDSIEVKSGTTVIKDNSFDGRQGIEPGNIPLVELWAKVPWIYLEAGGNNETTGLTEEQRVVYASAIVSGVKKAVPTTNTTGSTSACAGANTGDLGGTVLAYAWPDYRGTNYVTMKPEYAQATSVARAAGQYIGGSKYPGVDCGGFVTRAMVNSGFEPEYNYGGFISKGAGFTGNQLAWVRANWQPVGRGNTLSTSGLQPGDVAFRVNSDGSNDGHTFLYAGDIAGFGSKIASSSIDDRAPMAGKENPLGANIEWYRNK